MARLNNAAVRLPYKPESVLRPELFDSFPHWRFGLEVAQGFANDHNPKLSSEGLGLYTLSAGTKWRPLLTGLDNPRKNNRGLPPGG
jgi:hypothetical protein